MNPCQKFGECLKFCRAPPGPRPADEAHRLGPHRAHPARLPHAGRARRAEALTLCAAGIPHQTLLLSHHHTNRSLLISSQMTSFLNQFLWFIDFHSVHIMDGCDHLFSLQSFSTLPVGYILSGAIWLRFRHFLFRQQAYSPIFFVGFSGSREEEFVSSGSQGFHDWHS